MKKEYLELAEDNIDIRMERFVNYMLGDKKKVNRAYKELKEIESIIKGLENDIVKEYFMDK